MRVGVSRHEPVLGTLLELRIVASDEGAEDTARHRVLHEFDRLERIFSTHDPASELSRWRRGELAEPGPELRDLLRFSLDWCRRGRGAYNPAVGAITARWQQAEREGAFPPAAELAALARAVAEPPYRFDGDTLVVTGDLSPLGFNAVAKGRIVDLAAAAARAVPGVRDVTVNAGGDLVHHGERPLRVGIEDPARRYDNVAPLTVVELANAALATSGTERRGFRVGTHRLGHVIDPSTGRPVEHVTSASVVALDAATADVVATIVGVLPPADGVAFVEELGDVACLVVGRDGAQWRSASWHPLERPGLSPR